MNAHPARPEQIEAMFEEKHEDVARAGSWDTAVREQAAGGEGVAAGVIAWPTQVAQAAMQESGPASRTVEAAGKAWRGMGQGEFPS